jgi:hypothetical protein
MASRQGPSIKVELWKGPGEEPLSTVSLLATVEKSRSLHFLYLVGEVEKGGWLMVSLKWMTQLWVGSRVLLVEILEKVAVPY